MRFLQRRPRSRVTSRQPGGVHRDGRVDGDLVIPQLLGQAAGALSPGDGLIELVRRDVHLRLVAVRHGKSPASRPGFEDGDRAGSRVARVRHAPGPPRQPGDPPQVLANQFRLSECFPEGQGGLPRLQRLLVPSGQVGLQCVLLQQLGPLRLGQPVGMGRGSVVMPRRFPVCALSRGAAPGNLSVSKYPFGVPGQPGMVDQTARVNARHPSKDVQDPPVQLGAPSRRQRVLGGTPKKLVPKRRTIAGRDQHPGTYTEVNRVRRAGHDGRVGTGGNHRYQLGQVPRGRRQGPHPVQDQVLHGTRHRRAVGLEQLGNQQWVATAQPVYHLRVPPGPARLLGHACRRQRRQRHSAHDRAGQSRQGSPQRMLRTQLIVAVGHHQQGRQPVDAPAEEGQPVKRGLVCPVSVLHHDHRPRLLPWPGKLVQQSGEDLLLRGSCTQPGGEDTPRLPADVVQRTQRTGSDQPIAAAPQHPSPRPAPPGELGHDRGLAEARLAGDHRHPTAPGALAQQTVEEIQCRGTLPQLHELRV